MNDIDFARSRFVEEMNSVHDRVHVLLKGHFLIEESLSRTTDQFVFHRGHVEDARLSFADKMNLSRALCLTKNLFGEWDPDCCAQRLRNVVAHTLKSPQRERKFARVRELYVCEASDVAGIENIDDMSEVAVV